MVGGLGEKFDETEVKQFFMEHGRPDGNEVDIIRTNVCYDIHDYIEMSDDRHKVQTKLERLKEYTKRKLKIPSDTRCFCFKGDEWDEEKLEK